MKPHWRIVLIGAIIIVIAAAGYFLYTQYSWSYKAGKILDETGVKGGLVVHVGCTDGKLTAALHENDRYLVHGLTSDAASVAKARKYIQQKGLYGEVSLDRWRDNDLPYVDNLVNLLVVQEDARQRLTEEEMMRVLAPNGVAYVEKSGKWNKKEKPWEQELDEWTHYMHDPQGTFQSKDKRVGLPRGMRWNGGPKWARSHEQTASMHAMVSAKGRVFYVIDEGPTESIQFPSNYVLTARDAFNGKVLWKKELSNWFNHLYPLKSGPGWMPRRLVAVGDHVYLSPGIGQNLLKLDAATGEVLHEYSNTATTFELIVSDGTVFAAIDSSQTFPSYRQQDPNCWNERDRASTKWGWKRDKGDRLLKALDSEDGELLWHQKMPITPMTLATKGEKVCLYNGSTIVAFDRNSGDKLWETKTYEMDEVRTGYSGPRLIIKGDYIVFAPQDQLFALSADNGEILWSSKDKPRSGHFSLEDVYVMEDKVWVLGRANQGRFTTYSLDNGKKLEEYENPINSFYIHQRCYPGRATEDFLFPPMMGVTGFNMKKGEWEINHWVRGGCIYGMMPANGLLYTPPHACACYYQSKLTGFNALTDKAQPAKITPENERLQKGPAYGKIAEEVSYSETSWPVYRHDNGRTGYVKTSISSKINNAWRNKLADKLSQPVVAGGRLFVSAIDEHTVYALDADTGEELWHFTAGGRIDSPPTIYKGMALFGCADGHIYAVRANDGKLIWRYQAAPGDRRIMSYDQLESAWPVSGSVLIEDDKLYCVAGRSMFLDGGLRMVILNPQTGELISENTMDSKVPNSDKNLQDLLMGKHMPVAQPDILSSDGKYIYMRSQTFNKDGKRVRVRPQRPDTQYGEEVHLFSPTSFLDDSWHHRTYWLYGRAAGEGWAEFQLPPKRVPYGRVICIDEKNAYSYGRLPELLCNTSINEYKLYSANKIPERKVGIPRLEGNNWPEPEYSLENPLAAHTVNWKKLDAMPKDKLTALDYNWEILQPDIMARAMVLAEDKLFLAGPKDVVDQKKMWGQSHQETFQKKMQEQTEWLKGKHGAFIWVVSKETGKRLAQYKVGYLPKYDGLIAAEDKLYMVSEDGEIICYEGQ